MYRGPTDAHPQTNYESRLAAQGRHGGAHAQQGHGHASSHGKRKPASRAMHVLIVDGSADAARELGEELRKLGLDTAVAKTLAEARQLISQRRPDLIVADRKLPDGSGLEFHDIASGTRLVISSTNPDPNEFPPGTRILAKPVNERSVQEMVRVSLNRTIAFPT
jgi:CheY-like chemotaxis protein